MSSFDTMIPTGGVDGRRVVDRYDPNEHLMDLVMSRPNMQRAWKRVKTNFGAPGVDQMTVDQCLKPLQKITGTASAPINNSNTD